MFKLIMLAWLITPTTSLAPAWQTVDFKDREACVKAIEAVQQPKLLDRVPLVSATCIEVR